MFFRNGAVNRVYLHAGVQALAQGAGQVFTIAYLLKAGVPPPLALLAMAGIVATRFALRPLIVPLGVRVGLKPLLIAGTAAMGVQYLILPAVHGVGAALAAFSVASALAEIFYYPSSNAYFAAIGDAEHRGHQMAARQAVMDIAGIAAPLLGTAGLLSVGPWWTFGAVAAVQAASALPLLGGPNVAVPARAPGAMRAAWPAIWLLVADGWFDACYIFVWQIALFLTLAQSYAAYGAAMALASVVGVVCGLVIGRHVDRGGGRRATKIAYSAAALIVVGRGLSLAWPPLAVAAHAAGALLMPLLIPPLGKVTANIAKASPCPLRVNAATDGGWDVGCFTAYLIAAGMLALGSGLALPVLLALPAVAAGGLLLLRQYPAVRPRPA
jgi:hypothetical protein